MGKITFMVPVLPGKLSEHQRFCREIEARSADHARSRKRLNIDIERCYYQRMPDGSIGLLVHLEGFGTDTFFQNLLTSTDDFDQWFVQRITAIHGLQGTPALPKLAWDIRTTAPEAPRTCAFCLPLPEVEVDAWWDFVRQVQARQPELRASRDRAGIHREIVHLAEQTPAGPCVLFYLEGVGSLAESGLLRSDDPFDRWFIDQVNSLHGIDFPKLANDLRPDLAFGWSSRQGMASGAPVSTPLR